MIHGRHRYGNMRYREKFRIQPVQFACKIVILHAISLGAHNPNDLHIRVNIRIFVGCGRIRHET